MTDDRRSDWQLIDDALRTVEVHRRPDSPRSGAVIVYVLLALLGVGLVGLGFAAWLATR